MTAEWADAMKKELEAILDSLPPQPPRSRLDPYSELIDELRVRNWTYRGIAQVLAEKCNLKISPSNIHHFVKLRQRQPKNPQQASTRTKEVPIERDAHFADPDVAEPQTGPKKQSDDEIRKRIDALKRRTAGQDKESKAFEFDPDEPLRLNKPR